MPTKQYPVSTGVLMEGFWRVKVDPREGRFDTQRGRPARTVRMSRNILCGPVAAAPSTGTKPYFTYQLTRSQYVLLMMQRQPTSSATRKLMRGAAEIGADFASNSQRRKLGERHCIRNHELPDPPLRSMATATKTPAVMDRTRTPPCQTRRWAAS